MFKRCVTYFVLFFTLHKATGLCPKMTTFSVSKCRDHCVPPGCTCNESPLSSKHFYKVCRNGSQTQCPLNVCSVPVVKPCVTLRERVTHKKKWFPKAIEDLRRSKRSHDEDSEDSDDSDDIEVEFCLDGEPLACFPICTKDVTTVCVALDYTDVSEENQQAEINSL